MDPYPASPSSNRGSVLSFKGVPSTYQVDLFFQRLVTCQRLSTGLSAVASERVIKRKVRRMYNREWGFVQRGARLLGKGDLRLRRAVV